MGICCSYYTWNGRVWPRQLGDSARNTPYSKSGWVIRSHPAHPKNLLMSSDELDAHPAAPTRGCEEFYELRLPHPDLNWMLAQHISCHPRRGCMSPRNPDEPNRTHPKCLRFPNFVISMSQNVIVMLHVTIIIPMTVHQECSERLQLAEETKTLNFTWSIASTNIVLVLLQLSEDMNQPLGVWSSLTTDNLSATWMSWP